LIRPSEPGELTQAKGQALFSSESFLEQSIDPHIMTGIGSWADKMREPRRAEPLPAEPDKAAAEAASVLPPPAQRLALRQAGVLPRSR
jgi:hypothetical protein